MIKENVRNACLASIVQLNTSQRYLMFINNIHQYREKNRISNYKFDMK